MQLSRKQKIIIGVAIALVAGGLLYYFLVLRQKQPVPPGAPPRQGVLPRAIDRLLGRKPSPSPTPLPPEVAAARRKRERLFRISQGPAIGGAVSPDGTKVRYFLRSDGALWESDFEGLNRSRVGDIAFQNPIDVVWSPKGDAFIAVTSDEENRVKKYYRGVSGGVTKVLNANVNDVAWSPDGASIAYNYLNPLAGDNTIAIANPDGSNFKTLRRVNFRDFALFWPKKETIVIATRPSGSTETFLYRLDTRTGLLAKILAENRFGVSLRWSPDGNRVLLSHGGGTGSLENILAGGLFEPYPRALSGFATLAEKCAFRKDSLRAICGIPQTSADDAFLPDDYYKGIFVPNDEVREANLATQARSVIARAQELFPPLDVFEPFLPPDEGMLFFLNRQDDYLYALRLSVPSGLQ